MEKFRVLITGVTGFLGSNLAIEMLNHGYEVVAIKRRCSLLRRIENIISKIYLYDIEDLDYNSIFNDHGKIDVVIHTATCYGRHNESTLEIFNANTSFPLRLLDAASNAKVGKFINTDTILDKYLNLYSLSKNHLLEWGKFYSMHKKIEFINMRLEHFYGPRDDSSKFTTYVIDNCILNTPTLKLTLGEQRRDFIYVDDVVSAYLTILTKKDIPEQWFTEFDVGSGYSITIRKFVESVHKLTDSKTKLNFGAVPYRDGEVMSSEADVSALKALGWECKVSLEKGLNLTIKGTRI